MPKTPETKRPERKRTKRSLTTRTAGTCCSPWEAIRFAANPTEVSAAGLIQTYGLEADIATFMRMVSLGRAPEDIGGHGMYESNMAKNECGGWEHARGGTHCIFTIPVYLERARTLLPLFPDALGLDPRSDSYCLVVKKMK